MTLKTLDLHISTSAFPCVTLLTLQQQRLAGRDLLQVLASTLLQWEGGGPFARKEWEAAKLSSASEGGPMLLSAAVCEVWIFVACEGYGVGHFDLLPDGLVTEGTIQGCPWADASSLHQPSTVANIM